MEDAARTVVRHMIVERQSHTPNESRPRRSPVNIRSIYKSALPYETRYWLYKLRHPDEFRRLRSVVNHHPKADFSLRGYDRTKSIFVHITKSAGTSVARSLYGELPYHYTAVQYRVIFGRRTFDEYFKFAFVRNPWDRLYSAYSYLRDGGWNTEDRIWFERNLAHLSGFDDFVLNWLSPERLLSHIHFWPQRRFLCDRHGRVLIDHLGYFETLESDFACVRDRVNPAACLTHTNRSTRSSYLDAYSAASIRRVQDLYDEDITLFGYTFDGLRRKSVDRGKPVDA